MDEMKPSPDPSVSYSLKIKMNWVNPAFTIPAGAHFTVIAGMIHNDSTALWISGSTASKGLEDIAEVGSITNMQQELTAKVNARLALQAFYLPAPAITGEVDTSFVFTLQHNRISFASMIAPSPDWFMSINNFSLMQDGQWVNQMIVPIYLYDAGTEEGDVFGYNNPETNPLQAVSLLTPAKASVLANGNTSLAPIGTISFTRN
ncbi:MAG: spondin domain-containing protein [Ferruginibacter sp.]